MKKFYARWDTIKVVEVERETASCVFMNKKNWKGNQIREAKNADWYSYHDTWQAAHDWLVARAQRLLDEAKRRAAEATIQIDVRAAELEKVKALKEPEEDR